MFEITFCDLKAFFPLFTGNIPTFEVANCDLKGKTLSVTLESDLPCG